MRDDTILLIRFSSIGDLVLLTSLVEALRDGLPHMKIHLVTKERYRQLFEDDRRIDSISVLPDGGGPGALWRLRRELAGSRYGILIDAHGVIRSLVLARSLAARRRIRIAKDQLGKAAVLAGRAGRGPVVTMRERYLDIARRLGLSVSHARPRLEPSARARARAADDLRDAGLGDRTLVAIAPGARWPAKRWPAERYEELARILDRRGLGIVLVGAEGDGVLCGAIRDGTPAALDLCGGRSVIETAAVLEACDLLVTNDSAPLHVAESVGTPVVALYGPTVRAFGYYPMLERSVALEAEVPCRPCSRNGARRCRLERLACLEAIGAQQVADTVETVLSQKGSG